MFKVYVDLSLFTDEGAFGMISGELTLPVVPQVGDLIAFAHAEQTGTDLGHIRVTTRIIQADGDRKVLLALEDVTAASLEDARRLAMLFQEVPGLVADVWEP